MSDPSSDGGLTPSQTIGPFYHYGLRQTASPVGASIDDARIRLRFIIRDGDDAPVSDAMVEIWHADAAGRYPHPDDPRAAGVAAGFRGFARVWAGADGSCEFETIRPGPVPGPDGEIQAPHVALAVFARGLNRQLVTRAYFAGDPANASDPILQRVPEARRPTLLAKPEADGVWSMEIRLQDEHGRETVFFDL